MGELALGREVREICERLQASRYRDAFELTCRWAVRMTDLRQALLDVEPDVVHFSGHSTNDGIMLESARGLPDFVGKDELAELFGLLKGNVRVVVFNACCSREHADAVTRHIDCAIAFRHRVGDEAAIDFAAVFYEALAYGRSVHVAFGLGRGAARRSGAQEEELPDLILRGGIEGEGLILLDKHMLDAGVAGVEPAPHAAVRSAPILSIAARLARSLRRTTLLRMLAVLSLALCVLELGSDLPRTSRDGPVRAFSPGVRGVVVISEPSSNAHAQSLCEGVVQQGARHAIRCVVRSGPAADADALLAEARGARPAVVVILRSPAMVGVLPLEELEGDAVFSGDLEVNLVDRRDRERLAVLLYALALLAVPGQAYETERAQCPPLGEGPPDHLALLTLLLIPSCGREPIEPAMLFRVCDEGSPRASWSCALARLLYVERCPDCPHARPFLELIRDQGPPRFRFASEALLALKDCEEQNLSSASRAVEELLSKASICERIALTEVAACIRARSSGRTSTGAPAMWLFELERLAIAEAEPCRRISRVKGLEYRAFWRGRSGSWEDAASDYHAAFMLSHEPIYVLSEAEALLHLGRAGDAYKLLVSIEGLSLPDVQDRVYAGLLRWLASYRSGQGTAPVAANALLAIYGELEMTARGLRDDADRDLRSLVCQSRESRPCLYDILASPKAPGREDELKRLLEPDP